MRCRNAAVVGVARFDPILQNIQSALVLDVQSLPVQIIFLQDVVHVDEVFGAAHRVFTESVEGSVLVVIHSLN